MLMCRDRPETGIRLASGTNTNSGGPEKLGRMALSPAGEKGEMFTALRQGAEETLRIHRFLLHPVRSFDSGNLGLPASLRSR
jgi:hypothetical protein